MILLPGLLRSDAGCPFVNDIADDFPRPDAGHDEDRPADNFEHWAILMPRLPGFIGGEYEDLTRPVDAQATINLFPEKVESGSGSVEMILRKCPGTDLVAELTDTPIRGQFAQDGRVFIVAGGSFFELYDDGTAFNRPNSYRRIASVAVDDSPAAMVSNGAGGNQLLIVTGGLGYIFDLRSGAFGRIGSGFPANARRAEFLDGYFFTMSGLFTYASNLEDGLTWNAASKAQRSTASDDLQSIIVDGHKVLWMVGSKTSEPWYDAGLNPFPLTPVSNSFMSHGTGARDSVTRFDNSVFMLGQNEDGDRYAFIISNGQSAQRISTHAVENAWRGYETVSDAIAWTYAEMGHAFAVVTFPSAKATWVYDASTQLWHRRGVWNTTTGTYDADRSNGHCFAFGRHLVGSHTNRVYAQSLDYQILHTGPVSNPSATAIRWVRRAPHLIKDRQWLIYNSFELVAATGVGRSGFLDPGSAEEHNYNNPVAAINYVDPLVGLRYSDDGGYTWSNERTRSMGRVGTFGTRMIWNRLGRSRDRVFEISGSSHVKVTLMDALVDVS